MSIKGFNMDIRKLSRIQDMANLYENLTGVKGRIWVSFQVPRHAPRVKVKIKGEEVSISISDKPEILAPKDCKHPSWYKEAIEWIKLNKEQLLKFWNDPEIDMYEFIMSLKRV